MITQESTNKKKKRKLKPIPVVILAVTLIAIIFSLSLAFHTKPKEESVTISISGVGESKKSSDINESNSAVRETKVSIDMDSCAIPIGTTLKVTASIDPSTEVEKSFNWSSSDQNVFTVDAEGIITIKGKGTSALTATIGSSSDAIVIEGIANDNTAKSQNNLPIFNLLAGGASGNGTSGNGTSGNGTSGKGTSGNGVSGNGTSGNGILSNGSTDNGSSGNETSNNGSSGNETSNNGSANTNTNNTGNPEKPIDSANNGTNNGVNSGLKSTDLYQSLSEIGYSQKMSNVYVYEENNTYYGEIIIQSNVTIIYIKQRCDGFDTKIKEVIAKLIPTEYSLVWNNYISASSDRTFTAEGRMVRILTALNGGHSQIVIYN